MVVHKPVLPCNWCARLHTKYSHKKKTMPLIAVLCVHVCVCGLRGNGLIMLVISTSKCQYRIYAMHMHGGMQVQVYDAVELSTLHLGTVFARVSSCVVQQQCMVASRLALMWLHMVCMQLVRRPLWRAARMHFIGLHVQHNLHALCIVADFLFNLCNGVYTKCVYLRHNSSTKLLKTLAQLEHAHNM